MNFEYYELPSGIRCILKRVKSPVVYCSLTIGTGSRDESDKEHGMAHLIEHMLFKGTPKRKSYHINSLLDNVGGEINAYTTKEETVIHTTTLKADVRRAVDLITDMAFHSLYDQREIDKEVRVIIDEINSYKDSPSEQIYDDFEDMIFTGSTLGRNILGTKKSLVKIKSEDVRNFVTSKYNTDNMVFAIIGDISVGRFKDICDSYFKNIPENRRTLERKSPEVMECRDVTLNKHTHQVHAMIGGRAYPYKSDKRVATALALNILGGPSANSRLNLLLREKHALTYNIEANYTSYCDTGMVAIYFSCDSENLEKSRDLIHSEIENMQRVEMSAVQLKKAKKQLIGQLTISSESAEGYMLSCAKSYLMFGEVDTPQKINDAIDGVESADIMSVMNEMFTIDNMASLTYL